MEIHVFYLCIRYYKFVTSDFIPVKTIGERRLLRVMLVDTRASDDNSTQWDVENAAVDGTIACKSHSRWFFLWFRW